MNNHKIIFIGPVGAGKTTAISVLSDSESLNTDAVVSDATAMRKGTTTVAMDYGRIALGDSDVVHLYGTPGQARFKFMWELLVSELAADCAGLVMLLDITRNYPLRDLRYYAREFANIIGQRKLVIGVTRSDIRAEPDIGEFRKVVAELGLDATVCFIDARRKADVLAVVQRVLEEDTASDDWLDVAERASVSDEMIPVLLNDELPEVDLDTEVLNPDISEPQSVSTEHTPYHGEEIRMKESIVDNVMNVKGVAGAVLSELNGDVISSSIENDELNDLVGFLAGMAPQIEQRSELGVVQSVVLRSPTEGTLSVFMGEEQVLGIHSESRGSVRVLKQQVEDLLQWS